MKHVSSENNPAAIINEPWPEQNLEQVDFCPMCNSDRCRLAFEDVHDWSFNCAPGSWNYWRCGSCRSLYLNPRPSLSTIGLAYGQYYTHAEAQPASNRFDRYTEKLRNEYFFHWLDLDTQPRFNFKSASWLSILKPFMERRFPVNQFAKVPRGSLLDVGCGNGDLLQIAKAMGFDIQGLEIDPLAVHAASTRGLPVRQGSFDLLEEYKGCFDYVVCSHVIEHVHNPRNLLDLLLKAAKPNGRIFITWPNPESIVLRLFGRYWRGLEAPRHLCLPSLLAFSDALNDKSLYKVTNYGSGLHTIGESWFLRHGKRGLLIKFLNKIIYFSSSWLPRHGRQDFNTTCIEKLTRKSD